MELQWDEKDTSQFNIVATLEKPRSLTCSDTFFIANTEVHHFEEFLTRGTHTLNFKTNGEASIIDT